MAVMVMSGMVVLRAVEIRTLRDAEVGVRMYGMIARKVEDGLVPALKGQRLFNDMKSWWQADAPGEVEGGYDAGWYGVDVPKTGTFIKVVRVNRAGVMTVRVGRSG